MPDRHIEQKITLDELGEKFEDIDVPETSLAFYFEGRPDASSPFNPVLQPDPRKVILSDTEERAVHGAGAFNWLNAHLTRRRQKRFKREWAKNDGRPMLVFEGDSWFQFPLLLDDVVDVLFDTHNRLGFCMSAAGAELSDMVGPDAEYPKTLDKYRDDWKVFLFSGGGNDIVGAKASGDGSILEDIILRFEPGKPAAEYINNDNYRENLASMEKNYEAMLDYVTKNYPGRPILLHGYAHAWPGGYEGDKRHVIYAQRDQWIGRYMRGARLGIRDHKLQHEIVVRMIDDFNAMLKRLCGGNNQGGKYKAAYHIDARGLLLTPDDWNDELHPNQASFRKVGQAVNHMIDSVL